MSATVLFEIAQQSHAHIDIHTSSVCYIEELMEAAATPAISF